MAKSTSILLKLHMQKALVCLLLGLGLLCKVSFAASESSLSELSTRVNQDLFALNDEISHNELTSDHLASKKRAQATIEALKVVRGSELKVKDYGFFHQELIEDRALIAPLYKKATSRNLKEVVPFAQLPQGILISSVFQSDLLGYILRKNIKDKQSFNVKSFYRPYDANLRSQVKVDFYKQGKCQGESLIFADLLDHCESDNAGESFIEKPLPHQKVIAEGVFRGLQTHLPKNRLTYNSGPLNLVPLSRFIGFISNARNGGFKEPLSPFDKHLYVNGKNHFVKEEPFGNLRMGCSLKFPQNCELYFKGPHVESLINLSRHSWYELEDGSFGLPILIGQNGNFWLDLDHTLLSKSNYKNYAFFTGHELAILQDLGFKLDSREYYGAMLYHSGTQDQRLSFENYQGYGRYLDESEQVRLDFPSLTPMGVGLHILSSFIDVRQNAGIATIGEGAIGVRIDGVDNTFHLPYRQSIVSNGDLGSGIAVTYGRENQLNIEGNVVADGKEGVAILADFGSNLYSDLTEYRGSYQRNSTILDKDLPVPDAISGPLVNKINVSGKISGRKAAIFISPSAYVKEINLHNGAFVQGGIFSLFTPQVDAQGHIYVEPDLSHKMRNPTLQIPEFKAQDHKEAQDFIEHNLSTKLNFGLVRRDTFKREFAPYQKHVNKDAVIVVQGNIIGENFELEVLGGKAIVEGLIKAKYLHLDEAMLRLNSKGLRNQLKRLVLKSNAVLDLVNGQSDLIEIKEGLAVGHNATIRVDVDESGKVLDRFKVSGDFRVRDGHLRIEPGVKYEDLRRLGASPMQMLSFITNFVKTANKDFEEQHLYVRFPEYIWDSSGAYGRELRCSERGCRIGKFVKTFAQEKEDLTLSAYILSIGGLVLLVILTFVYFNMYRLRNRLRR